MTKNRWSYLAKRLLEPHGYRVTGYSDPLQALEVLRADPHAFDVVITDYNMPSMSGLDVAREVREIRSNLPVAIASGFADETLQLQYAEAGVQEIVSKLGAMEGLRAVIERAVKSGSASLSGPCKCGRRAPRFGGVARRFSTPRC